MRKQKLFGTDGIRGKSNVFPITPDIVLKVGQALGCILRRRDNIPSRAIKVVIGKDTRLSGYMIEMALASGLNSMGVHVQFVGPLPTPGIGFLTRNMRADAGVVISASHNAYYDNGIKIFGFDGYKISEEMEREIEELVFNTDLNELLPSSEEIGRSKRIEDSTGRYIVFVKDTFPQKETLDGIRIVLDCAHGASYKVAPMVLQELGAEVIVIGNKPNGTNINDKSGALYPSRLGEAVVEYRADVGIALDGDADRVIMTDKRGKVVNGDQILAICAIYLKECGKLPHNTVVATQMSNFGLEKLMTKSGISLVKTDVGDRNVIEEMRNKGYVLGGEQSGHIIFLDHSTTGDGLIAGLSILGIMKARQTALHNLVKEFEEVPQILINLRVNIKIPLHELDGYEKLHGDISEQLKGAGRIFVRYSGTESVVRILVEGPSKGKINELAEKMAKFLQKSLG